MARTFGSLGWLPDGILVAAVIVGAAVRGVNEYPRTARPSRPRSTR
jgi:hypothetical protein